MASKSGGDISQGVLFGVVAGGISGAAMGAIPDPVRATSIWSKEFAFSVGVGSAKGAIAGTYIGATAGYAGGAGDINAIGNGALKGAIIGGITGGILGGVDSMRMADGQIYVKLGGEPGGDGAVQFSNSSQRSVELSDAGKFFGIGKAPAGAYSISPNMHQFLFSTMPTTVTYSAGAGIGMYMYDNRFFPTTSHSFKHDVGGN